MLPALFVCKYFFVALSTFDFQTCKSNLSLLRSFAGPTLIWTGKQSPFLRHRRWWPQFASSRTSSLWTVTKRHLGLMTFTSLRIMNVQYWKTSYTLVVKKKALLNKIQENHESIEFHIHLNLCSLTVWHVCVSFIYCLTQPSAKICKVMANFSFHSHRQLVLVHFGWLHFSDRCAHRIRVSI